MTTIEYLDAAKLALGVTSDYALAKHLELTPQAVSKLRMRGLVMGNTTAARVAQILSVPLARVIADCELERGSSPEFWKGLRDRAAAVLVALGAAIFGVSSPSPVHAAGAFDITPSCVASGASGEAVEFARRMQQKYTLRRIRRVAGAIATALVAWLSML